ncbi:hypothetical protein [Ketobacter sp.]|uniref:hypothetical protein n=1 Tax=Ketobacter sp. TaxID=2083498 RepID=UPI000F23F9FC|nr:hypothetical protein [Ketobacter sp.]RLT92208.1 MAG: hypothetical protein D9N14_22110 [Ketobacter sp.]
MPLWVTLYVALMVVSLPVGVLMLRRIEQDWLHPVGGLVSTLLSVAFVFSYWMPDAVPFHSPSVLLLFGFVLFWDLYSLKRLKQKLPDYFEMSEDSELQPNSGAWLLGVLLMVPAYYFGALVCLRVIS